MVPADWAVTPAGRFSTAVTGSDGALPVLVTLMGSSIEDWPGVSVTPPVGPAAVSVGWPGGGGGGAGLDGVGATAGADVGAAGDVGGVAVVVVGMAGRVVCGVVVGWLGAGGTTGFGAGCWWGAGWLVVGRCGAAVGTACVELPVIANASTAASAATDAPTPTNCLGTDPAAPVAPDAALVVPAVPAAVAAMPAPALAPVAAR